MIFNSNGPVYKQVISKPITEAPQEPKKIEDESMVAEDVVKPVKVAKTSKAKKKKSTNKED